MEKGRRNTQVELSKLCMVKSFLLLWVVVKRQALVRREHVSIRRVPGETDGLAVL